jgi:MoaA/NifB/PqqE/SkfB family radical SAM enzyme
MIFKEIYCKYITTALGNKLSNIIAYDDLKKVILEAYDKSYKKFYPNLDLENSSFNEIKEPEATLETVTQYMVSYHCNSTMVENEYCRPHGDQLRKKSYFLDKKYACAAPYTTLRFEFNGDMSVCCANKQHIIGTYPSVTPYEAWNGSQLSMLRRAINNYDFHLGCQGCLHQVLIGNETNTMMEAANIAAATSCRGNINSKKALVRETNKYPLDLTFQLQNNCNYECIMCSGEYSSSICKNRDGKQSPPNVYDDSFLEKIKPFLQHAESCNFLGGEPFLIPIYYDIWNILRDINPECRISITSNGSIYTKRIEDILLSLPNSSLVISLDSLIPETYAYIRRRGDLNNVLSNIDKFVKIDKLKSLAVCPIIQNVYELPNFVNFCIERNINLWINNVTDIISNPGTAFYKGLYENGISENINNVVFKEEVINEFRLWTLPQKEKIKIKNELFSHNYPKRYQDKIISFTNFLLNYKHDTAPKE